MFCPNLWAGSCARRREFLHQRRRDSRFRASRSHSLTRNRILPSHARFRLVLPRDVASRRVLGEASENDPLMAQAV